jgi:hypothetical protein
LWTALEWILGWVLAFASAVGLCCTEETQGEQGKNRLCGDHLD